MEKKIVASQNDIARVAKVSRSTVSRAFINHPSIPPETRRRIFEIADKLGYKKNPVVSMLTAQIRSNKLRRVESTLAYMTTLNSPIISETNPAYYQFYVGAKKRAEEMGYGLDTIWRKEKAMTSDRVTRILSSRGIKGVVLAPRPDVLSHITLKWDQFATVAIGHPLPAPRLSFSGAWHYDLISKALRAISKYGYRRVGFAIAPDADRYSQFAFSARYHLYQNLLPAKLRVPLLYRPLGKDGFDIRKFERWFAKARPEVILHAGRVIPSWLERLKISVPGDVASVDICLDSDDGKFAGVFERPEVIAAAAVDLVVEQLHSNTLGPPVQPKIVQTAGLWVDGPTLPRRK